MCSRDSQTPGAYDVWKCSGLGWSGYTMKSPSRLALKCLPCGVRGSLFSSTTYILSHLSSPPLSIPITILCCRRNKSSCPFYRYFTIHIRPKFKFERENSVYYVHNCVVLISLGYQLPKVNIAIHSAAGSLIPGFSTPSQASRGLQSMLVMIRRI
jgi:hypothetical protein